MAAGEAVHDRRRSLHHCVKNLQLHRDAAEIDGTRRPQTEPGRGSRLSGRTRGRREPYKATSWRKDGRRMRQEADQKPCNSFGILDAAPQRRVRHDGGHVLRPCRACVFDDERDAINADRVRKGGIDGATLAVGAMQGNVGARFGALAKFEGGAAEGVPDDVSGLRQRRADEGRGDGRMRGCGDVGDPVGKPTFTEGVEGDRDGDPFGGRTLKYQRNRGIATIRNDPMLAERLGEREDFGAPAAVATGKGDPHARECRGGLADRKQRAQPRGDRLGDGRGELGGGRLAGGDGERQHRLDFGRGSYRAEGCEREGAGEGDNAPLHADLAKCPETRLNFRSKNFLKASPATKAPRACRGDGEFGERRLFVGARLFPASDNGPLPRDAVFVRKCAPFRATDRSQGPQHLATKRLTVGGAQAGGRPVGREPTLRRSEQLRGERLRRRPFPQLHKDLAERARLLFRERPLEDVERRLRAAPRQSTDEPHKRRTDGGGRLRRGKRPNNRRQRPVSCPLKRSKCFLFERFIGEGADDRGEGLFPRGKARVFEEGDEFGRCEHGGHGGSVLLHGKGSHGATKLPDGPSRRESRNGSGSEEAAVLMTKPDASDLVTVPRRTLLRTALAGGVVAIGGGAYVIANAQETEKARATVRNDGKSRLPPSQYLLTKLRDMGGTEGDPSAANFKLKVYGEVDAPFELTFKELLALPQTDQSCDVHCVTKWTMLDATFTGVRVKELADKAKVRKAARHVIFEAAHGYTSNVPIAEALAPNVLVAHRHDGKALGRANGAPVRALVPDLYFWKSAKWLTGIRFVAKDEPGYWETRGYHNHADPWREERYG